jgi:hypothetical protein
MRPDSIITAMARHAVECRNPLHDPLAEAALMNCRRTLMSCLTLACFACITCAAAPDSSALNSAQVTSSSVYTNDATPQQFARLQEKLAITQRILAAVRADALAKGASADWRVALASVLYGLPNESLRRIEPTVSSVDQAHAAASREVEATLAAGAKSLGDASRYL